MKSKFPCILVYDHLLSFPVRGYVVQDGIEKGFLTQKLLECCAFLFLMQHGFTALHVAASSARKDSLTILLGNGADINMQSKVIECMR